jgi:RNA polymerase-binding transcription factor DksA
MSSISSEQLQELKKLLEVERESVLAELNEHGTQKGGDWQGASATPEGQEADPIDAADQIEELAVNVPLVETLEKRLLDVDDALMKIGKGGYGICEESGEPIPHERLFANPAARTKVELA